MLRISEITKRYSWGAKPAVDRVSLELDTGEVVGLVGLNGAGKTTTIRVATGVLLADSGQVEADGLSLKDRKVEASRLIGWVPEQPTHDSFSSVGSLIRYYSDVARNVPRGRGERLLDCWGMRDLGRKRFRELSLGYRRRLAVVVASLTDPKYFLLDEPFNGLDPLATVQFRNWIARLRDEGRGVLLSSHLLREVQSLCQRIVVIHHGRILSSIKSTDLARTVQRRVTLILKRVDPGVISILEPLGEVTSSEHSVTVTGTGVEPGQVNSLLVNAGYSVEGLSADDDNLEEFFLRTVNGAS